MARGFLLLCLAGCTASAHSNEHNGESAPVAAVAPPSASVAPEPSSTPVVTHEGPLANFYDALSALERGERKEHVRIAWLGDSHAQADFWTGYLRRGLQKRFGNGGPGFVHLGYKDYRHEGVDVEVSGSWRFQPKKPATTEPFGDGAFGLGGMTLGGYAGDRKASIELTQSELADKEVKWDLCYKIGPEDEFKLTLGDKSETIKGDDEKFVLRHLERRVRGLATLKVEIVSGRPDFCGVAIETETPGVVLDNLGINGARYKTPLAWKEEAWGAEVRRRPPELFVFEYGGNEAGDGAINADIYKRAALELVARVRRIAADASCLVVAPADRSDVEDKIPPIVVALRAAAAEAGCMFWNTYEMMGGRGSMRRWRDDERAAADGIHLKPKGYVELGALLLADLMAAF
ncbi:MAG TPA: GDSL-type esterase/lipase family protein [Polyangiaceae bacterium]|jgi:hypothetical protein|nr:GDSL-type esterase/lipase family protein [Polyangiaceae bacterium]